MEDVPENESTQTTDQILGFYDIEGEEQLKSGQRRKMQ